MKKRVFIDMDGTVAEWKAAATLSDVKKIGYFSMLRPNENMLRAAIMLSMRKDVDTYILSKVLDNAYAIPEKTGWLRHYAGNAFCGNRVIFVPMDAKKADVIPGGIVPSDVLVDDFSQNLLEWQTFGGRGIKVLNDINGAGIKWQGKRISIYDAPEEIVAEILKA